jgi:hypothetical protein
MAARLFGHSETEATRKLCISIMRDMKSEYKNLSANLKRRNHLGDSGLDGRITLNFISRTQNMR